MLSLYLPAYGKFAQVDPAYDQTKDDPETWNLYNYVTNNPVTHTDPDGRSDAMPRPEDDFWSMSMSSSPFHGFSEALESYDGYVAERLKFVQATRDAGLQNQAPNAGTSDGGTSPITNKPSNIAPIQPDRFDGFASRTEAEAYAKDFIIGVYGKNGGMDYREYGFYIYQTSETIGISKIIQGPVPEAGKRAAVDVDMGLKSVPRGATLIEDAHTHPRFSASGGRGLTASGEDMLGVRLMRGYGEDGVRYKGFIVDPRFQGVLMRIGTPGTLIYWGDSLRKGNFNDGEGPQVWR